MLGIPGAGKGTQAKKMAEKGGIVHISTGDIFREAVKNKTETGMKAEKIMKRGDLVPDELVISIVMERLKRDDAVEGYILDGFPRTLNQAKEFDKSEEIDNVIYISLNSREAVSRLTGRRKCKSCGAGDNIYLSGNTKGKCKNCGGEYEKREDDNEETARKRIKKYVEVTEPLIDYYRESGKLIEINGNRSIEEVFKEIENKI